MLPQCLFCIHVYAYEVHREDLIKRKNCEFKICVYLQLILQIILQFYRLNIFLLNVTYVGTLYIGNELHFCVLCSKPETRISISCWCFFSIMSDDSKSEVLFIFFVVFVELFSITVVSRFTFRSSSWLWSYGSWIYNYLCNQCLSPTTNVVSSNPIQERCSQYNIMW